MENIKSFLLIGLMFLVISTVGQNQVKRCGSDLLDAHYRKTAPNYASNRAQFEGPILSSNAHSKSAPELRIPIVVHVIYNTPTQNISKEQIESQIAILNRDFNALNADKGKVPAVWQSLIGDADIKFVLADRDPNGNITNGITRTSTTVKNIGDINGNKYYQTSLGGHDIWDRNSYLNFWVCEVPQIYGFGSFPGSPAVSDGVVVSYTAFGDLGTVAAPVDKGRTATHEVAHWLNLEHLWGRFPPCDNDYCADTPEQDGENYGCKTFPEISTSCSNGPNGDMFMNFMDYSDDNCLIFFTKDQVSRMRNTINNARPLILDSKGWSGIEVLTKSDFKIYPLPASDYLNIESNGLHLVQKVELYSLSGKLSQQRSVKEQDQNHKIFVGDLSEGMYLLKVYTNQGIFAGKIIVKHP